jgi:hypothetical protein
MNKELTIVWQRSRVGLWENDWIEYLFRNIPHTTIENVDHSSFLDNSVLVESICWAPYHNDYVKGMVSRGLNFGLIHLTDEDSNQDISSYPSCKFVLRNYYRANMASNVLHIPLGWNSGFTDVSNNEPCSTRKLQWSTIVHRWDQNRNNMASAVANLANGKLYVADHHGPRMTSVDMSKIYRDSVFVLCPNGAQTVDSFRVTEALEAGCIPIVQRSDYWFNSHGPNFPAIQIDSWNQVPGIIHTMMQDQNNLEALRLQCVSWWNITKTNTTHNVEQLVQRTM